MGAFLNTKKVKKKVEGKNERGRGQVLGDRLGRSLIQDVVSQQKGGSESKRLFKKKEKI